MRKVTKKKKNNNKKLVLLAVAVLAIGIGFAALQKYLNISGVASVNSYFNVRLSNVEVAETTGSTIQVTDARITGGTTLNLAVILCEPGDSITYTFDVINNGNLNAKLINIENSTTTSSDVDIDYDITGIELNDIIVGYTEKTVTLKITLNEILNPTEYGSREEIDIKFLFQQTNEETASQLTAIDEFEATTAEMDYAFYPIDGDTINMKYWSFLGDGGEPNTHIVSLYDDSDNFLAERDSNGIMQPYTINIGQRYRFKVKNKLVINGTSYYNNMSSEQMIELSRMDGYILNLLEGDPIHYEIVKATTAGAATLPLSDIIVSVRKQTFIGTNTTSVQIPSGFDLSKLEQGSLSGVRTIYNNTGNSIDWVPILNEYGVTCEFVTGTCGSVTIATN